MRLALAALATLLLSAPLWAADVYISAGSSSCSNSSGAGTEGDPYVSLNDAMTRSGRVNCGDTVYLRGGTYQMDLGTGPVSDDTPASVCDDDEYNDLTCSNSSNSCMTDYNCPGGTCSGANKTDGSKSVLPIFKDCTSGAPLLIQNYPGETVIIDGTTTQVANMTWTKCDNSTACGAATTGLALSDPTCTSTPGSICDNTWFSTSLNVGSAQVPQIWLDPAGAGSTGTRLVWDAQATKTIPAGSFVQMPSNLVIVVRTADGSSPGTHTLKVTNEGGANAAYPVIFNGASYVTLRRNPDGGDLYVKHGYFNVNMTNTFAGTPSDHITVDGIKTLNAGTRQYGFGVRGVFAVDSTIRNVESWETSAEGLGFYGGGPTDGLQLSNNLVEGCYVHDIGFGCLDGGGFGPPCLGEAIIMKNCSGCTVRGNRVTQSFRAAIQFNISANCTQYGGANCNSDNGLVERNELSNYCHDHSNSTWPPTQVYNADCGAITIRDSESGTVNSATIRNNMIYGNFSSPSISGSSVQGILLDSTNGASTGHKVVNNSVDGAGGACFEVDGAGGASTVTLRNNAFNNCCAGTSGCNSQLCDLYNGVPASWTITHTNNTYWAATDVQVIRQNAGAGFLRSQVVGSWEATATQADPLFVSGTNLHLQGSSTLVNGGTSTDAPSDDFDAQTRSGNPDIGADEIVVGSPVRRRPAVLN